MTVIDDAILPAAAHLTGDDAFEVLAPAVAASGGRLAWCRASHVQYRPASDVVVRYRAGVVLRDGTETVETLLAGTTVAGPHAGTLPLEARMPDGSMLHVGVWKWPFDPVLTGLPDAVTPTRAQVWLRDVVDGPLRLHVVAYRPTERAVVRVEYGDGHRLYLKVVPPHETAQLTQRHRLLLAAGLPVPTVVVDDVDVGLIAMADLAGPTLRELIKAGVRPWPSAADILTLRTRLAASELVVTAHGPVPPVRPRTADASAHAAMLAKILPSERPRLAEIAARFDDARVTSDARPRSVIHGDLHEGQLIVDTGVISGVLDVDDVGPGDPVDDLATLIAHLRFRSSTTPGGDGALTMYTDELRQEFATVVDADALDTVTAAVLVGLATGPFRIQQEGWQETARVQLDHVDRLLDAASDASNPRSES